jgi:hypothetical protein
MQPLHLATPCRTRLLACVLSGTVASTAWAQQLPDTTFHPAVDNPAFAAASGPVLCLDEAHHNFHTLDNRFWAFGELARRDGFTVVASRQPFTPDALARCRLLVISNAQPSDLEWNRYPSPTPSAFTAAEVATVRRWVGDGGRLLLIADHMPLAGAARSLAEAFGVRFTDGFAVKRFDAPRARDAAFAAPTLFRGSDGTLAAHAIVRGRGVAEEVSQVRSFTGQAFRAEGAGVQPLLILPGDFVSLEPRYAWQFDDRTPTRDVGGWLQGATTRVGKGRAAFFGEAAMFSAQRAGPQGRPMGMNAPMAEENAQFTLNVLRWLAGVLEP